MELGFEMIVFERAENLNSFLSMLTLSIHLFLKEFDFIYNV